MQKENVVMIKHLDTLELKEKETIQDTLLQSFEINDKFFVFVSKCNITHTYLMASRKLPFMYFTIMLHRQIRSMKILEVFVYFTIESDINCKEDLLENSIYGRFTLETWLGGNAVVLDDKLKNFDDLVTLVNSIKEFLKRDSMIAIYNELI